MRAPIRSSRSLDAVITPPTTNQETYDLYLEGKHYRARVFGGAMPKAIDYFQGAIQAVATRRLARSGHTSANQLAEHVRAGNYLPF